MTSTLISSQPVPSSTEKELVVAVRAGSDLAFEELYSRYRERIFGYILRTVGDYALAEDVAQEVFISALRRMRATERPIAFRPWIYEIAKNACIDEFRRPSRAREVPLEPDTDDANAPRTDAGPDAAVEEKLQLEDLRGAFRGLSETHHRIIVLRELEGRSYQEIGDRMGLSKPMVESTLFRARRRLGEEYDELVSGRRCEQTQRLIAAGEERTWRSLGVRQRRQLARHLAHCQPCRRAARRSNIDERFFDGRGLIGKVAALLPIPWLRSRRTRHAQDPAQGSGDISTLGPLQTLAPYADQLTSALGAGRAVAAAAAVLIGGGGIVSGLAGSSAAHRKPGSTPAALSSAQRQGGLAPIRPVPRVINSNFRIANGAPHAARKRTPGGAPGTNSDRAVPRGKSSSGGSQPHLPPVGTTVKRVTGAALGQVKLPNIGQGQSGGGTSTASPGSIGVSNLTNTGALGQRIHLGGSGVSSAGTGGSSSPLVKTAQASGRSAPRVQ